MIISGSFLKLRIFGAVCFFGLHNILLRIVRQKGLDANAALIGSFFRYYKKEKG